MPLHRRGRRLPANRRLQVVTHSLPALTALAGRDEIEVVGLGGTLQHISQSFAGPTTLAAVADIRVSTFFMAASGITERGVFCGSDFDAVTKRALMNVTDEVVLLTDSSKFSTTAMVRTCPLEAISAVVVDDGITDEWRARLEGLGVRVIVVSASRWSEALPVS
jgi:DeoR/GlpR family transcriptional regulator of sugar metabolism